MSVSPIGGVTGTSALQQPTAAQIAAATAPATTGAAQASPTVDAAQAWEDAMRAAMGDESPTTTPATSAAGQATTTPVTGAAGQAATTPALTPQALAALVSGSSTASADPLVTSLSAPADAATPTSDASAGSFV